MIFIPNQESIVINYILSSNFNFNFTTAKKTGPPNRAYSCAEECAEECAEQPSCYRSRIPARQLDLPGLFAGNPVLRCVFAVFFLPESGNFQKFRQKVPFLPVTATFLVDSSGRIIRNWLVLTTTSSVTHLLKLKIKLPKLEIIISN